MRLVKETKLSEKDNKKYTTYYLVFGGLKVAIKPVFENDREKLKVMSYIVNER